MKKIKWNYETAKKESLKYKSRGEFYYNKQGAYKRALINGWLNEFFPKKIPEGYGKCSNKDCQCPVKLISEFYTFKNKNGKIKRRSECKICSRKKRTGIPEDHRKCLICKEIKLISDFDRNNVKCNKCHENSIDYRIIANLRTRLWQLLKEKNKCASTMELIDCTVEFLKQYLEKFFYDGMSWKNYGKYWHVDHIIPCISFDLTDPEQQKKCFHWTNLQPLTVKHNMEKGSKLNWSKS